jgi:hypothetical protein
MSERKKKASHIQHEDWLARRPKATSGSIAKALEILDRPTRHSPEEVDKLPKGYVSVRRKDASER